MIAIYDYPVIPDKKIALSTSVKLDFSCFKTGHRNWQFHYSLSIASIIRS